MTSKEILNKIIPNAEFELPLSIKYLDKLTFHEKEKGKWYVKSFDSEGKDKLVFNEETNKSAPEEIVRQLFLYELHFHYSFPIERIKVEQKVTFGHEEKKRADIIVYQNDNYTPLILVEVKAPNQKHNIQQLKGYLNAEGSPLGVGFNGKNITRFIRPYPKEFDTISDLPTEQEYQTHKDSDTLTKDLKEAVSSRNWTLPILNQLNKEKHYDLKAIIEELEELVLANSGVDSFDEIFKLIYTKLYDEFEAENRKGQSLWFRDYSKPQVTYDTISKLFEEAKKEWRDVFEPTDKIKLTPEHLEIVIGKLTEVKLYGANLRIIDEAFEYLVPDVAKGKKGQYFTPRIVIDTCVQMLNPNRKEAILDPACGSAGFLLHAMEYVWDKYDMKDENIRKRYASKFLWGIDFEERTTKISRALMLIAGDGKTHIFKENTLEFPKWNESFKAELLKEGLKSDKDNRQLNFDIIMSNPPFAGEIKEKGIINQYFDLLGLKYTFKMEIPNIRAVVKEFSEDFDLEFIDDAEKQIKGKIKEINENPDIDLEDNDQVDEAIRDLTQFFMSLIIAGEAHDHLLEGRLKNIIRYNKNSRSWEKVDRHILFIQRILDMLTEGGRCVIVLPQGIFNNSQERFVRRFITQQARILAVVGLHGNSFKPHTGTKTSCLFLRKYSPNEAPNKQDSNTDYPIFFATSNLSFKDNSGRYLYAKDEKGNTLIDKKGNQIYLTDLYDIADAFKDWGLKQLAKGDNMFDFLKDRL